MVDTQGGSFSHSLNRTLASRATAWWMGRSVSSNKTIIPALRLCQSSLKRARRRRRKERIAQARWSLEQRVFSWSLWNQWWRKPRRAARACWGHNQSDMIKFAVRTKVPKIYKKFAPVVLKSSGGTAAPSPHLHCPPSGPQLSRMTLNPSAHSHLCRRMRLMDQNDSYRWITLRAWRTEWDPAIDGWLMTDSALITRPLYRMLAHSPADSS